MPTVAHKYPAIDVAAIERTLTNDPLELFVMHCGIEGWSDEGFPLAAD
jgi:hypothetical protein